MKERAILGWLSTCLVLVVAACGPDQAVDQDTAGTFLADVGAERVVELVFPDETPFAQAPVLKWDHLPTVLVLIEDNVSEDVRTQLDTELQELERRLPLKSLVKKQIPDAATDLPSDALKTDIVLVIGHRAIESSSGKYWPILRSAMESDDEAGQVSVQAVTGEEPVIQRFKVPFATGIMQRVVAMIRVRVRGKAADSTPRISGVLFSALCPSIGIHGRDKRIFGDSQLGPRATEEAYRYVNFLYSDFIPIGMTRTELAKKIGAMP